jgi:hypothetical protein
MDLSGENQMLRDQSGDQQDDKRSQCGEQKGERAEIQKQENKNQIEF